LSLVELVAVGVTEVVVALVVFVLEQVYLLPQVRITQ
jgi:hypothetical protein